MIKNVNVTFTFDTETDTVSNVNCFVDGIEKKKKTTRKKKDEAVELEDKAILTLESNKIVFNNRAISDMQIEYENRIVIKYEKFGNRRMPIIGKDTSFDEEGSGNKVTKSNTVTYRGKANTVLAEYGTEFELVPYIDGPYKEGVWRMVSLNEGIVSTPKTLDFQIKDAEKIEPEILTEDDSNFDIDELTFQL